MYRFDALSAFSTLLLTLLALYTGVSPGLTAFVLIAASQCKSFIECTSVEIVEFNILIRSCVLGPLALQALRSTANGFCLC